MSLIHRVLNVVVASGGAVNLGELSRLTGVQPAALQGILDFCARKGYLLADGDDPASACASCAAADACGLACGMVDRKPRSYRLGRISHSV